MKENLLLKNIVKKVKRTFVKYCNVLPKCQLQVIEMNMK